MPSKPEIYSPDKNFRTERQKALAAVANPMMRPISFQEFADELQYSIQIFDHEIDRLYKLVQELRAVEADEYDISEYLKEIEYDLRERTRLVKIAPALPANADQLPYFYYDDWLAIVGRLAPKAARNNARRTTPDSSPRCQSTAPPMPSKSKKMPGRHAPERFSEIGSKLAHNEQFAARSAKSRRLFSISAVLGNVSFASTLKYRK